MAFQRIEITAKVVQEAARAAAERRAGTNIWADTRVPYLQIRQRAGAAKWMMKGMQTVRSIGDIRERRPDFLSVTDARKAATAVYTGLRYGDAETPVSADETPAGWTWEDLDREYQAMIAQPRWINRRMKPPSPGTCDDVRLAFARPSFQALHTRRLTELDRPLIHSARDQIESHRQKEKNIAYFKAAMTWAADKHPDVSGLSDGSDRWWERLSAGEPDADTMHEIEERRQVHLQRKADLDVKAIGTVLVAHERYCAGRTAEDKISPGVRWGLWWVAFTANRRASTVQLQREDFLEKDPLGETGWGRAAWPPAAMKAKTEFWLPLPPAVRDVATGSIADYTELVAAEHGDWPSAWVFASTRRYGRDEANEDVSVYPNSLNRHIQRMRDAGALDGLPYFSLHLVRSAMGDYIADKVSGIVSSLVLAHTLPQDDQEAAPTTRQYYLTSQRMLEKAVGMRAWSEALIRAYLEAGGVLPVPSEARRKSKIRKRDHSRP